MDSGLLQESLCGGQVFGGIYADSREVGHRHTHLIAVLQPAQLLQTLGYLGWG